jgi:peptide/nickel transport system permease protein
MSPTNADQTQSGGSIFETVSDSEMSDEQKYARVFDEYVRAPFRILWENPRSRIGMLILLGYAFMGTIGVVITAPPTTNQGPRLTQPFQSMAHPLGTDFIGQDMLSLVVHSTPSMFMMIAAGGSAVIVLGTVSGLVSGFKGGRVDRAFSMVMDLFLTIPGLPLIIVLSAVFEPEHPALVGLILAVNSWAALGRQIRSQVISIREQSYVEASRIMGIPTRSTITKDVLPNLMPYITISFVRSGWYIIFASVALYFLGILPFTNLNWGVMMNIGYQSGALLSLPVFFTLGVPMVAVVLLTFGLLLFAQGADEIFNPRVRLRHTKSEEGDRPGIMNQ